VPGWRDRPEFVDGRTTAQGIDARFDGFAVVDWIHANTEPGDVFLHVDDGSWNDVLLPGLAGRKSVSINVGVFSNPFVDFEARQNDARRMVRALSSCRLNRFERLARDYGRVRYVMTQRGAGLASVCPDLVPTVYSDGAVSIQRIGGPR
jgi:hypothetical protein